MGMVEPDDGRAAVTPKDTASARVVIIAEIFRGMFVGRVCVGASRNSRGKSAVATCGSTNAICH